jgi:hypothetical protein
MSMILLIDLSHNTRASVRSTSKHESQGAFAKERELVGKTKQRYYAKVITMFDFNGLKVQKL